MTLGPDPLKLLEATCNNLREQVVPALSGPDRYEALLAVSAISIVVRELSGEPERSRSETENICQLLGKDISVNGQSLRELEIELAESIRTGKFTAPGDARLLWTYLNDSSRRTLQITNPKVAESYRKADETE